MMEVFKDIFGMPLFPHLYAIPISIIFGIVLGYYLRGKMESTPRRLPPKPKLD